MKVKNMTQKIAPLTERQTWKRLAAHYQQVRELHLRKLFADDPTRGERMTVEAVGLYLDYSKNRITDETLQTAPPVGGGLRPPRAHRGHVSGGENQHHRKPCGVACGVEGASRCQDPR